ncbi:cleavage and polyadenylation specific factor 4 [Polychytrium aggregatum]|uniref:cleavage and polyadenylation specific factor 4 n=1 Tax=Polychytrium aggregatum TaxID=110093 RepID=UPI0022FEBF73|nr:cleavage and polyadenylation specific factor 4 [Polychytrium aggregatum]KAI9192926.1 cleavage and polyadenylation specific factor 4 [Polychytrium aggregatum]
MTLLETSYEYLTTVDPAICHFEFEEFIRSPDILPFIDRPVPTEICKAFQRGNCPRGLACPLKHARPDRSVVCKHWLRGLCKKGDMCEFLHEYNLKKMPECWFFTKYGECSNPECMYLHVDPASKMKDCPWYDRGFCKHGAKCRHKHVRKAICPLYLTGFCPKGPDCALGHPKYELPNMNDRPDQDGHDGKGGPGRPPGRSREDLVCFRCGEKGHYANSCRKPQANRRTESNVGRPIPTVS